MKKPSLVDSLNCAVLGLLKALRKERYIRIHLVIAFSVLVFAFLLNLEKIEVIILLGVITLVFLAELFNTALEVLLDSLPPVPGPNIRLVKDIAASAVLITSLNALLVGYLIFIRYLPVNRIESGITRLRGVSSHTILLCLGVVLVAVIVLKVLFHRGTPLRGGMPSGHSAVAFSVWTVVTLLTANPIVSVLVLGLAVLVARSRITKKAHNIWEVVAGALLGLLATVLIMQLVSPYFGT